jgi:hypothetical protein
MIKKGEKQYRNSFVNIHAGRASISSLDLFKLFSVFPFHPKQKRSMKRRNDNGEDAYIETQKNGERFLQETLHFCSRSTITRLHEHNQSDASNDL